MVSWVYVTPMSEPNVSLPTVSGLLLTLSQPQQCRWYNVFPRRSASVAKSPSPPNKCLSADATLQPPRLSVGVCSGEGRDFGAGRSGAPWEVALVQPMGWRGWDGVTSGLCGTISKAGPAG